MYRERMGNVLVCCIAIILMCLTMLVGIYAGTAKRSIIPETDDFEIVARWESDYEKTYSLNIVRNKSTDVLYMQSRDGSVEPVLNRDGEPLTYEQWSAMQPSS